MKSLINFALVILIATPIDLKGQSRFEFVTGLNYPINYSEKKLSREIGLKIGIEGITDMRRTITFNYGLNAYCYFNQIPNYNSVYFGAELPLFIGFRITKKFNLSTGFVICYNLFNTNGQKYGFDPEVHSDLPLIALQSFINWGTTLKYVAFERTSIYINFQNPLFGYYSNPYSSNYGLMTFGIKYILKNKKSAANTAYKQWRAFGGA